jgi:hypothetical protein
MKEIKSDIWSTEWDGYWRVIPINTTLYKDSKKLVMGAGLAKQARDKYENLDGLWGSFYALELKLQSRLVLYHAEKLIGFPTKIYWKHDSSLDLIENGLKELNAARIEFEKIVSPRLGCGLGGLNWEREVKPLVEMYFGGDDNFVVVN